jgi:hypothetical protein
MHRGVGFDLHQPRDGHGPGDADAPEIVTEQVHDHEVLRAVLHARRELARFSDVVLAVQRVSTRRRALDRFRLERARAAAAAVVVVVVGR